MSTWLQLATYTDRTRVRFAVDWDIFPECRVPAGTECTVIENGLNELAETLFLRPDDERIRQALREWNGLIYLSPSTHGYEWTDESPVNLTY